MSAEVFRAAQAKAAVPGSVVLAKWMAERQAAKGRPQASVGIDSGNYAWGGQQWGDWVRSGMGGVGVDESTVRAVAAVVACTNLIGGSIGSLPLHFYRMTPAGDRERIKSDFWWMFNERPHAHWSASAFWQYLSDARLFHGDAFAKIRRAGKFSAAPESFEPWHPSLVDVERQPDGRLLYTFRPRPEDRGGRAQVLEADDVLHVPGPGFNGVRSVSQLQYGLRNPAGIAAAADEQAGQFMADGARPDFAVEVPGDMQPEQRQQLQQSWLDRHSGPGSKKAPVVLAGGIKLHQLTMSMEDAQLLTTRSFQVEEICRIFGVPPFMIGHTDKTTSWGSGIEQMSIGFVKYTLQRHLVAIEQEINHKLFKTARNFAKFLTAGLERGDIKTRYEAYRIGIGRAGESGWIKPSEVRALEDMERDDSVDAPPAATAMPAEPATAEKVDA